MGFNAGWIEYADVSIPGDLNGDLVLDLTDVILTARVLVGFMVPEIHPAIQVDVDGDGKIGLPEMIHQLSSMSQN